MADLHYQEFYLDIDKAASKNLNQIVTGRLGDNMLTGLIVNVLENDKPFDLTDYSIRFEGTTSASTVVVDADNVEIKSLKDGKFKYTFSNQVFSVLDQYQLAYFAFEKNSTRATTENFVINVIQDVDITWEEAESYISILNALIRKFNTEFEDSQRVKAQTFEEFLKNKETQYQTLSDTAKKLGIDLAAIQTSVTQLEKDTSDLDTKVKALDKQVGNLKTTSEAVDTAFKSTKQKVDNLDVAVKGLEEKTGTLKTDTADLDGKVSTLKTDTSTLEQKTEDLKQSQIDLSNQLIETNEKVDAADVYRKSETMNSEEISANVINSVAGITDQNIPQSFNIDGINAKASRLENGVLIEFSQKDYSDLIDKNSIVRAERTVIGEIAEIDFNFDVIKLFENLYPHLFFDATTTTQKLDSLRRVIKSLKVPHLARGKTSSKFDWYNYYVSNWANITLVNSSSDFVEKLYEVKEIPDSTFGRLFGNTGIFKCRIYSGSSADVTGASWIEIKDIQLIIEFKTSAKSIIDYTIAQYNVPLVALLNDAIERIEILEQGGNA